MQNAIPPEERLQPDPKQQYYDARQFLLLAEDGAFVNSAYDCILKRPPDQEGFESYCERLAKGALRQQVLADLRLSEEGKRHGVTLTHLESFLAWLRFKRQSPLAARVLAPAVWAFQRSLNRMQHIRALQLRAQFAREQAANAFMHQTRREIQAVVDRVEAVEDQAALLRSRLQLLKHQQETQKTAPEPGPSPSSAASPPEPDRHQMQWAEDFNSFYLDFEIAFRGSRKAIHERLAHYLNFLPSPGAKAPWVVDLGCGRGEWLSLLQGSGYTPWGLDSSPVMQQICREQGLNVSDQPMHLWLQGQPHASIAAITAFHLAEHLPFEYLLALIKEAKRLLMPGGVLILETQNPESLRVSAYAFYHDPTHRNPLTPELLEFTARYVGFEPVQLERLSEVPEDLQIRETDETAVQFNQLLNAPRDLALIAFQPDPARETAKRP